ncbi:hypothetical protein N9Z54_06540 [Planctomycetota bacterium]|jgi:hypothetical protein|nr:hypothetical protein [Planctomycetota bacterium]
MILESLLLAAASLQVAQGEVTTIGQARQLFVDRHLVESTEGCELRLAVPRDEGAVFEFDAPWEGRFSAYSTVIAHEEGFLLYYRGLAKAGADGSDLERTCVAVSDDGLSWRRPSLGLFEVDGDSENGDSENNVVLAEQPPFSHNFSPFLDTRPGVPEEERFKALSGVEATGLMGWSSADGLRWERVREEPVMADGMFDSQNVAFWSELEACYVCYMRTWTGESYTGFRSVSRSTSADFLTWTPSQPMAFTGEGLEHIYTNQTHPYFRAPQTYVAIAARFMPGRAVLDAASAERLGVDPGYFRDCSDAVLLTSRGGLIYDRTFREAFLRPGFGLENWVSRSNYPALNVVQTGPAEMSLYVNQNYAQPTAALHRYSLRLDGFASLHAGFTGGVLTTRPLRFEGNALEINYATSAAGGLRVEIVGADGEAIPGFGLDGAGELIGNEIDGAARWVEGADLGRLEGRAVRLRFHLRDGDVYSWRFHRAPILGNASAEQGR